MNKLKIAALGVGILLGQFLPLGAFAADSPEQIAARKFLRQNAGILVDVFHKLNELATTIGTDAKGDAQVFTQDEDIAYKGVIAHLNAVEKLANGKVRMAKSLALPKDWGSINDLLAAEEKELAAIIKYMGENKVIKEDNRQREKADAVVAKATEKLGMITDFRGKFSQELGVSAAPSDGTQFSVTFSGAPGADKKFSAKFKLSFSSRAYEGEGPVKVTLYGAGAVRQCFRAPCPQDKPKALQKALISRQFPATSCKKAQVSNDDETRVTEEDAKWTCTVSAKVARAAKRAWEKSGNIVVSGGITDQFEWRNGKQVTANKMPDCPLDPMPQCARGTVAQTIITDVKGGCSYTKCVLIKVCTDANYPVCDTNGKTHTNDCTAKQARVTVAAQGSCDKPTSYACTEEYNPVCGADGKTYGNLCAATTDGVLVVAPDQCARIVQEGPNPPPSYDCPQQKPMVCGDREVLKITSFDKYKCPVMECVITGAPPAPSSAAPSNSLLGSLLKVFGR